MKVFKTLLLTLLAFSYIGSADAANINSLDVQDSKTILVTLEGAELSQDNVEGELKLLKDLEITFTSKDFEDSKKMIITLGEDLRSNTIYSLLSVFGEEGNMDFLTPDVLEGFEITDNVAPGIQGITKVFVSDLRTIELTFNNDIVEEETEFKVFYENSISSLSPTGVNSFTINTVEDLLPNSDYIVMVIELKDFLNTDINLDEDLYDIVTPSEVVPVVDQEDDLLDGLLDMNEEDLNQDPQEDTEVNMENTSEDQNNNDEDELLGAMEDDINDMEFNAAEEDEGNIEDIALTAETTPETGAPTQIFILLILIANAVFFLRKKATNA